MAAEWVTVTVTDLPAQSLAGATAEISFGTDRTAGEVWLPTEVTIAGSTLTARALADPAAHVGRSVWIRVTVAPQVIIRRVATGLVASFAGDSQAELDATAIIRGICGWHIAGAVTDERGVDSDGGRRLALRTLHLRELVSVSADGGEPLAGVGWSESGLLELRSGWWPCGLGAVSAVYTHGYDQVPADLAAACRSMAKHVSADTATPVAAFTKTQGSKTLSKTFSVGTIAALVGNLSNVEQWVLERYALGPLP